MMEETVMDSAPEAAAPEGADPEPEEKGTTPPGRPSRRIGVVEVAALVVIVGLAVALIVSRVQLSNQDALNGDRTSAVAAARVDATDVSTYDYRHLHEDFGRVKSESTPSFARSFTQSSDSLSKVLLQYKAVATGKVLSAGVVSITSTRAVVILFVNQAVTNSAQKGVTTDDSRILVTLEWNSDRWLLQDLKLL